MTAASIREHFSAQLAEAKPLTVDQIEVMRALRRERLSPEQAEASIKASRLADYQLVGRVLLFYIMHIVESVEQPSDTTRVTNSRMEVLSTTDDALDQLDGTVQFERMSAHLPVFRSLVGV